MSFCQVSTDSLGISPHRGVSIWSLWPAESAARWLVQLYFYFFFQSDGFQSSLLRNKE